METKTLIFPHALSQDELRQFFVSHLDRIYCAKIQLAEKLPQVAGRLFSAQLQEAIQETVADVQRQLHRLNEIYIRMDTFYHKENCSGLIGVLDEAFQSIGRPQDGPGLRDLAALFYMQEIEGIEIASFKMLMLVADQLHNKEIKGLLAECYGEAREDKALFKALITGYL